MTINSIRCSCIVTRVDLVSVIEKVRAEELPETMEIIYMSILERYLKAPNYNKLVRERTLTPQQVIARANQYTSIPLGGGTE